MATIPKIGEADRGRAMTLEEFHTGEYEPGFRYELIDGKLYVSPQPNAPQGVIERWIYGVVSQYARARPDVFNFVHYKARVFVPGRRGVTNPEPDVAAYNDFPLDLPFREIRWQDTSPALVVEVPSPDDPNKDFERNVKLYFQVPSIREYWLVDTLDDPDRPRFRAHVRSGRRWRVIDRAFGETYTTRLMPGFTLVVDPHR